MVPTRDLKSYIPIKTYWRPDQTDKAFHPAWGYSVGAFRNALYPEGASLGEDLILARRLRDLRVSEADPIALGHKPYYLFGPWNNEHFSYVHKDYATWPERLQSAAGVTVSPVASIPMSESMIRGGEPMNRSFAKDWWGDDVR